MTLIINFHEVITDIKPEEEGWWNRIGDTTSKAHQAFVEKYKEECELEFFPEFKFHFFSPKDGERQLALDANLNAGSNQIDQLALVVKEFLTLSRPNGIFTLTYMEFPGLGTTGRYGGGAIFVTGRIIKTMTVDEWLHKEKENYESRGKKT